MKNSEQLLREALLQCTDPVPDPQQAWNRISAGLGSARRRDWWIRTAAAAILAGSLLTGLTPAGRAAASTVWRNVVQVVWPDGSVETMPLNDAGEITVTAPDGESSARVKFSGPDGVQNGEQTIRVMKAPENGGGN